MLIMPSSGKGLYINPFYITSFEAMLRAELETLNTRLDVKNILHNIATDRNTPLNATMRRQMWQELAAQVMLPLYFWEGTAKAPGGFIPGWRYASFLKVPELPRTGDVVRVWQTMPYWMDSSGKLQGDVDAAMVEPTQPRPLAPPEPTIEEPLFTAIEVATLGQALIQHLAELTPVDTPEFRVSEADWQRFWRIQQRVMVLIAKVVENGEKE